MKAFFHSHAINAFFDQHFDAVQSFCSAEAHAYVKRLRATTITTTTTAIATATPNRFRVPCCTTLLSVASCIFLICYVCYCCCSNRMNRQFRCLRFTSVALLLLIFFIHHTLYSFNLTRTVFLYIRLCVLACICFGTFMYLRSPFHAAYTTQYSYGVCFVCRVHGCSFNPAYSQCLYKIFMQSLRFS